MWRDWLGLIWLAHPDTPSLADHLSCQDLVMLVQVPGGWSRWGRFLKGTSPFHSSRIWAIVFVIWSYPSFIKGIHWGSIVLKMEQSCDIKECKNVLKDMAINHPGHTGEHSVFPGLWPPQSVVHTGDRNCWMNGLEWLFLIHSIHTLQMKNDPLCISLLQSIQCLYFLRKRQCDPNYLIS